MLGFPGVVEALLLISLGLGYIVLYLAKQGEKQLQFVGYIIGVIIITLSLVYLLGNLLIQSASYPQVRYHRGMMQQRMMMQPPMQRPPAK